MSFREKFARSPALVRFAPFVIFLLITAEQGNWGASSDYWLYFIKTVIGVGLIIAMRPLVTEMRWAFSWEAVVAGVVVFAVWVGLDAFYPHSFEIFQNYICPLLKRIGLGFLCSEPKPVVFWNPNLEYGAGSALAWFFIVVRIAGSALVVPPLEEVFYRSFLYRYLAKHEFLDVPLNRFVPFPFIAGSLIFGIAHNEWLAGILCGAAYQWLVIRKGRLGDAMTAHAITNFLLGVWVVWRGAWHFW